MLFRRQRHVSILAVVGPSVGPEWLVLGQPAHPERLGLRSRAGEGPLAGVCGAYVWDTNARSLIYPKHTRFKSLKGWHLIFKIQMGG